MVWLLPGGHRQPGPLLTGLPCARCPRSSLLSPPGHWAVQRRPSGRAMAPGAALSAVSRCAQLCIPRAARGGWACQGGRAGGRSVGELPCREGSCPGCALHQQVFPKMRVGLCSSHSPGREEPRDGSCWHRPGWHLAGDRALPRLPVPVLSPAPRAFLRPRLPLSVAGRDALSWRGPGHPPVSRRKDRTPIALPTWPDYCPLRLSPGLPSAGRPRGASGPSKCWGTRGSWGSGQLRASPKPRRSYPFASADAIVCYLLRGQKGISSWHMAWTEATSRLVWEDFRETRKSQHAHRYEDSEKEPYQGFCPF